MTKEEYERHVKGMSDECRRALDTAATLEAFLVALQEARRIERREIEAARRRAQFRVVR